jgi:hypothetical protein
MYRIFIVLGVAGLLAMLLSLPMWPSSDRPPERNDPLAAEVEPKVLLVPVKDRSEEPDVFVDSVLTYRDDTPLLDYP